MSDELKSYFDQAVEALSSSGYEIIESSPSRAGKNPYPIPDFVDVTLFGTSKPTPILNFPVIGAIVDYEGSLMDYVVKKSQPHTIFMHNRIGGKTVKLLRKS